MSTNLTRRDFLKTTAGLAALSSLNGTTAGQQADPSLRTGQPNHHRGQPVDAIPSLCEMCFWRCGILGKRHGQRLLSIEGNPDHPLNKGRLCARGLAGTRLLYDPDRLKYPLMRVGPRGEGRWRRASWSEALDEIANGLRETIERYGSNGVAYFPHGTSVRYFKLLMKHLGVSMYASASFGQCRGPRDTGYKLTFGSSPGAPERTDYANTQAILLTGSHLGENVHTSHVRDFINAVSRGAKLIVVDPRYSVAASKANLWLPIRPGTDIAFLLAVMHCLIEEELYDRDFVKQYCLGFDELRRSLAHATPQWAAAITDLPKEKIVAAARTLGHAHPHTVIHPGRFSTWYGNDTQRSRALAILTALLGAWGRRGGMFLPSPIKTGTLCCGSDTMKTHSSPSARPRRHPFISEGYPYQDVLHATLEGEDNPVRLWFLYGTNVLHSMPNARRTVKALHKLDHVFMVDVQPNESARYADVILPEATYLERFDAPIAVYNAKQPFIALRQPIVPAMYETRDPYWITKQLALRLGIEDCFPCENMETAIDKQFREIGTSLKEVARTGFVYGQGEPFLGPNSPARFRTPSGKVELYSKQLAAAGLDPIPRYQSVAPPPEGFLRLLNGRSPYHSFTRTMNNVWLAEMHPVNAVWINDRVAASVGLTDGDPVELENQDAVRTGPVPVKVTPGIRPEVAYLPHGWGQRVPALSTAHEKGASDNRLMTRFAEDPETGATGLRVNYVRLLFHGKTLNLPPPEQFGIPSEPEDAAFVPAVSPLLEDEETADDASTDDYEVVDEWDEVFPEESC